MTQRFEQIYVEHREAVRAYVRRRAPEALVDDVVSETFLVCLRRIDRVPPEPVPWLYAVAWKTLANERRGATHGDHGEPATGRRNGVAFSCVSFLADPQCVQLRLKGAPIDYFGRSKFISHDAFHRSLPCSTGSAGRMLAVERRGYIVVPRTAATYGPHA